MKKIGILGSGMAGQALAAGFKKHGYDVMIGSDHQDKLAKWKEENHEIGVGNFSETAQFGEIVVLSVKGLAADKVLGEIGSEKLAGKIIIDTTNPVGEEPAQNGVLKYFTNMNESLMEKLQVLVPGARFVKCFNSVGAALMVNPDFGGVKPTMFICGNDQAAKAEVSSILEQFGWEAEDYGGAEAARAIEPLCMLWCIPGLLNNEWTGHAFKMLKK